MLFALAATALACDQPYQRGTFEEALVSAEHLFSQADTDGAHSKVIGIHANLSCASFRLRQSEVASLYRLRGLTAFAGGSANANAWLTSARRLEPGFAFDKPLFGPAGAAWEGARQTAGQVQTVDLPPPAEGDLFVDGRSSAKAPKGIPWTLQLTDGTGSMKSTWVLGSEDSIPSYPMSTPAIAVVEPEPVAVPAGATGPVPHPPPIRKNRKALPLLLGGLGVTAIGGGGLVGSQVIQAQHFKQNATEGTIQDSREVREVPYSLLAGGGWGLVGVGALLTTVAVVNGEW